MNDLTSSNKLPSLAEGPDVSRDVNTAEAEEKPKEETPHEGANGVKPSSNLGDLAVLVEPQGTVNGADREIPEFAPPPGPPPQAKAPVDQPAKDSEGFTIPAAMNDPISLAQREAAATEDADQLFKLNIQSTPVAQDDPEATQAALSNVTNALTQMGLPSRKGGTIRGRRDVRNTIYVPSANGAPSPDVGAPPTPPIPTAFTKPPTLAALASEASIAGTSDTQSVRSGNSLGTLNHAKHPDRLGAGLNASVIETIAASFEDGALKTAKISGEIAFSYNPDEEPDSKPRKCDAKLTSFDIIILRCR